LVANGCKSFQRIPIRAHCAKRSELALCVLDVLASAGISRASELALPWIKQKTATECGRAVLASLAAWHGGEIEALYQRLPPARDRSRGYSILEIQQYGARVGVSLAEIDPDGVTIAGECSERPAVTAHFRRLADLVDAGHPVIVATGNASSRGHYLVLVGAGNGGFTVLDPSTPGIKAITAQQMRSMMCGFGYVALADQ
jgi:ABC-type bacteriocin/lantibiotic exporter with double-glycine peptidase domain